MNRLLAAIPPAGTAAGESLRAILVGAAFLLLFAAAETWQRRSGPPVEWTRKLVHFVGGLLAAFFPWLFRSPWTVVMLAAVFTGMLVLSRSLRLLGSVHGIERRSEGAIYYPVAICILYLLSRHAPVLYLISILTLVISDALAAVLGSTYGRWFYRVESDHRSIEGSVVFFLATFLIVHLPLLLLTGIDRTAAVLIGAQVALLVTTFEAISLHGSDNLIIPLGTYYLLVKLTPKASEWIGALLLAQLGIMAAIGLLAWRTHFLTLSGAAAAQLVLYSALSLGGPRWALPMVLALAGLMLLERIVGRRNGAPNGGYQVLAVFYASLIAIALLLASNTLATLYPMPGLFRAGNPFYVPFVGALAGQLAILVFQRLERLRAPKHPPLMSITLLAAGISFLVVVPVSLWVGTSHLSGVGLTAATASAVGALAVYRIGRRLPFGPWEGVRVLRLQAASVALATAVVLPLHLLWMHVI